jgi:hypothetical protein
VENSAKIRCPSLEGNQNLWSATRALVSTPRVVA